MVKLTGYIPATGQSTYYISVRTWSYVSRMVEECTSLLDGGVLDSTSELE